MAEVRKADHDRQAGEVATCPRRVFSEPYNESLVHEAARADMNARRQGTHSSLTRGEVAMTGAKAWRQKGTGRARVGALGVPHRRGGGNAFATEAAQLHLQGQPQGAPQGAAVGAQRPRRARLDRRAAGRQLRRARDQAGRRGAREVGRRDAGPGRHHRRGGGGREELPQPAARLGRHRRGVGVAEIIGHRSIVASEGALEVLEARVGEVERGADGTRAGRSLMDPRQVIVEPVVSEKSYALMAEGKYTFRVNDRAHKTQISHAVERDLRRRGRRGPDLARPLEAEAPRPPPGQDPRLEEGDRRARPGEQIELFEGAASE